MSYEDERWTIAHCHELPLYLPVPYGVTLPTGTVLYTERRMSLSVAVLESERLNWPRDEHKELLYRERIELLVLGLVRAGRDVARVHANSVDPLDQYSLGARVGRYEAYRQILEALGEGHRLPESIDGVGAQESQPGTS